MFLALLLLPLELEAELVVLELWDEDEVVLAVWDAILLVAAGVTEALDECVVAR
jgi:hypothetical protein